jgi:hypothetical protein
LQMPNSEKAVEESGEMDVFDDSMLTFSKNGDMSSLSGELAFNGHAPLVNPLNVMIRNTSTGGIDDAPVDEKGHFTFQPDSVRPGTYQVLVMDNGAASVPVMSATGGKVHGDQIEIPAGQTVHLTLGAATGSYQLDGIALHDGKPAAGMRIILVPAGTETNVDMFRFDQSDSDGTFSLYTVGTGKYTVIALENSWDLEWARPGVLDKYLAGATVIQVNAGSSKKIEVKVQ